MSQVVGRDRTINLDFGQNLTTIFALLLRVGSLNNVPSQVRNTVVPEVRSARRRDVRQLWAVLINFGRF